MNEDIKEILRYLEECVANDNSFLIGNTNATKLSYYINNLQKQLEKKDAYIKYLEEYNPKYYKGKKFYGDGREDLQEVIDEFTKILQKKTDGIKNIKERLGENAIVVNPHINILEKEYNYFLNKLTKLKGGNNDEI